jgi:hypothetical protein
VTLSAAEVNSGLTLSSSYTGADHPVATLAWTASNGANSAILTTTGSQTLSVTDPPSQVSALTADVHSAALELLMQHISAGFNNLSNHGIGGNHVLLGSAWSVADHQSQPPATRLLNGVFTTLPVAV